MQRDMETGDVYGLIEDGRAYIIRSVFNQACASEGISPKALLSHLKSRGLIDTRDKRFTVGRRINKVLTECISMKLPQGFEDIADDAQIPFDSP
jgi:hypothetical protein